MPRKLLDSDSEDDGGEIELKVNENYADSYQRWRQKEEYQKLKDKYGDNIISSDSAPSGSDDDSDDSDEGDEVAVPNAAVFDEAFFKVYGALKRRDPSIYNEEARFFPEKMDTNGNQPSAESASTSKDDKKKRKGMNLMEYHTMLVEKRDGVTEEDGLDGDQIDGRKVYSREMEDLKQEFKSFLNDDDEDEQESLIKAKKSSDSSSSAKNDLAPRKVLEDTHDEHISFLKGFWKKKDLDEKEEFLKSYILEKKYLDHDQRMPMPSSSQKSSSKKQDKSSSEDSQEDDEPSSKKIKLVDTNSEANSKVSTMNEVLKEVPDHHFLEEDAEVIRRYPRNVESIRNLQESSAKSQKRAEVKARKKKEKEEALQRFRLLKRAEIGEKLRKVAEISGNKKLLEKKIDVDLLVDDLNDFDPQKYDERMQQLFGDDYYGTEEDKKKPQFEYIPGIDDDDEIAEEEGESSKSKKKKNKKKSKKELDKNDPTKKKNIGIYDDIVGDQPTRFKYREVPPNDFGLTAEELLLADDKELNKWVSLKKTCQYRPIEEEKYDQKVYERKKNNTYLKKKVFKSLYSEEATQSNNSEK